MKFTKETKDSINSCKRFFAFDDRHHLEIYGEHITACDAYGNGVAVCKIEDLGRLIKAAKSLADEIEEKTGVVLED